MNIIKFKIMKTLLLLPVILFLFSQSYAQSIRGKVFDTKTGEPLEGVHVYVKINEEGTFTDQRGKYVLKLKTRVDKNDLVYFSHVGFVIHSFTWSKLKEKDFSVKLDLDQIQLDEIKVVAPYKLKPRIRYKKLASMKNNGLHSFASLLVENKIYVFGGDATFEVDAYRKVFEEYPVMGQRGPSNGMYSDLLFKARSLDLLSLQNYNDDLLIYDIKLDRWRIDKNKFRKRAYHDIIYSNDDSRVYILGGKRYSKNRRFEYLDDKIEVYDLKNNTIEVDKTNPHQAVDFESFIYKDDIIVMGGSVKENKKGKKEFTNKVHFYNTKTGLWYDLANMPVAKETKGVLVDDKIYLFGGFNNKSLKGIESYNLVSGKWKNEGELLSALRKPAITHYDDTIYLFENGKIITYNIKTKELKEYTTGLFLKASNIHCSNNKLYIVGGFKEDQNSKTPSADIFSIDLNEFKITRVHNSKILAASI